MAKIACPSCHKKIRLPDHLAGRRIMCPRCEAVITVPTELVKAVEEAAAVETTSPVEEPPFPLPARLGIISLILGILSTFLVCAPILNYLSIGLSSVGLLLGLGGLYRSRTDSEPLPPSVAGGVGIWNGFGTRVRDYPLAGVAACLLSLLLTLLPTLIHWWSQHGS
ncbi:MAG TPA: hypothetical protein VMF69_04985 [Gemmataceae bacterium]|nr:hypothetical protein [Gemmataceae bacterium]